MMPDKHLIRLRFARAAATYDQQAVVQRAVADRLLRLLAEHPGPPFRRVLEIGCGTGILTGGLLRRFAGLTSLYVNDLVPEFAPLVAARVPPELHLEFLAGDIETIPLPGELDLVLSSSTLHWLADLPGLLARLHSRMNRHATLCFSLYGPRNLREVRELTGIGLEYHPLAAIKEMVAAHFTLLACREELLTYPAPDPLALLTHLRQTGVSGLAAPRWSRARLQDFVQGYRRRSSGPGGGSLTYHPVYCLARKD